MRSHTSLLAGLSALLFSAPVLATDVSVVGLFSNKAVLVVDGAKPKTYAAGAKIGDGVRLVSVSQTGAVIDFNGRRETIALGEHINRQPTSARSSVTLLPDERGHYIVDGQINGGAVRMLLDTGATSIAIPASDARRLGINYRSGSVRYINTANGISQGYTVQLNRVKVGSIEIHQVEGLVLEQGLSMILLGMSFLNRTEMRREGEQMVLTKRF